MSFPHTDAMPSTDASPGSPRGGGRRAVVCGAPVAPDPAGGSR